MYADFARPIKICFLHPCVVGIIVNYGELFVAHVVGVIVNYYNSELFAAHVVAIIVNYSVLFTVYFLGIIGILQCIQLLPC